RSSVNPPYRYGPRTRNRLRSIFTRMRSTNGCARAAASIVLSMDAAFLRVSGVPTNWWAIEPSLIPASKAARSRSVPTKYGVVGSRAMDSLGTEWRVRHKADGKGFARGPRLLAAAHSQP